MKWLYGIPDFSLGQNFTYFNDLTNVENNSPLAAQRKKVLHKSASAEFNAGISQLEAPIAINTAINFIAAIANNERKKEIAAVQAYCKQAKIDFPFLDKELEEEYILNNPEEFYTKLTAALNKARLTTQQYINELKRILQNSKNKNSLADYFKDDYRYRLSGDLTSFFKKLIGTYKEREKNESSYSDKIHNIVIDIIKESDISKQIASGEDFAAIGAAILIDIEKKVQQKFDELLENGEQKKDFSELENNILEGIKKEYLDKIKEKKEETPIQRAINNINSEEFYRIVDNVKTILGIETLSSKDTRYRNQLIYIAQQNKKRSKSTKDSRSMIATIKNKLDSHKKEALKTITFKNLKSNSIHGNIQELILSLFEDHGIAGGREATDVISILCDYEIQPNDKILNNILKELLDETSQIKANLDKEDKNSLQDLRNNIKQMNNSIENTIKILEKELNKIKSKDMENFFVFHESLKLYSSIETGVYEKWGGHSGFGGRIMNILSTVDFILSTAEEAGISSPASRETLTFLSLNLASQAVGGGRTEPLANYFSIFAGLLMFDDVINIAKEAMGKLETSTVRQVHLYNLNGIYVPASMILSYVSDALNASQTAIDNSYTAKAVISYNGADSVIKSQLNEKDNRTNYYSKGAPGHYSIAEWGQVGEAVASNTKVKINFMMAFLRFIEKLSGL